MPGYDIIIRSPHKGPSTNRGHGDAIRCLAEYAARTKWKDLPPAVVEHARRILLDTIGVALGGSVEPEPASLARRFGRASGGMSILIGHTLWSSPLNAALVNGTAATWMDYDAGHRPPPGKPLLPAAHPPVHLVPAALAIGEAMAVSGEALLTALVVGYDAGARIGMSSRLRPEIHCHGTHHNVGAAVAVAHLMKAGSEQMEATIGLASHLLLMPSFENAYQGGTVRNTYAAVGAAAGILASHLAKAGVTPEKDALGTIFGSVISPWFDPDRLMDGLGKQYEISQGFVKLYPMCRFGHPAIEAAQKLIDEHPFSVEEIDSVEVHTFDWAATLTERIPRTDLAAKFSIPWAVASMLVRRSAGPEEFRPHALEDATLKEIAKRVTVREDSVYSAMTPTKRPARIRLLTKSGKIYQAEIERSSGGPDAPVPTERVVKKFRSLADPVIGPGQAEAVVEMVMKLEAESNIQKLTRLLTPLKSPQCPPARSCIEVTGEKRVACDHLDKLVEMAASISIGKVPSSIINEGKRTLVDTVGVIISGMREAQVQALGRQMADASVRSCSSILGSSWKGDAMWAALCHGTAGAWQELDAGNRFIGGHPALYSVSAGLPVAEREGVSGKRLIESLIGGYEVGARVGLGTTLRPGVEPHGSWPIIAAATTAGLLMRTDLRRTINLVTSLNLATSSRAACEGATIRNIYAGFGSAMGIFAADLSLDGFSAERDGISTIFGSIAGVFFDTEKALERIGDRWEIGRSYYRLYSCSRHIHPALDALKALAKLSRFAVGDIEKIEVSTYAMAASLKDVAPRNALAARFSIPYTVASYLILGEIDREAYSEQNLQNNVILRLAEKVIIRDDLDINRGTPAELAARVKIHLSNGSVLEECRTLASGEADWETLSDKELSQKFLKLTSSFLGVRRAETLLDKLWNIEKIADLKEITSITSGEEPR